MLVAMRSLWDTERNDAAQALAGRTASDHPLDLDERGLAMKATSDACIPHDGPLQAYQSVAALAIFKDRAVTVQPWHWITSGCRTDLCLNTEHLEVFAPHRLNYPSGVCVYCGMPAATRDHLLPSGLTGTARRAYVLTVPACGQCNSMINAAPTASITARRAIAHKNIRRKHARNLATRDWTNEELKEFGPKLRAHIIRAMANKAEVVARLEWPSDPAFDLRALQGSGIDDPYATGLLDPPGGVGASPWWDGLQRDGAA